MSKLPLAETAFAVYFDDSVRHSIRTAVRRYEHFPAADDFALDAD